MSIVDLERMALLLDERVVIKVSSVLNKNVSAYGKQFLVDGSAETCWNSDQGSPQWIVVDFNRDVFIESVNIQFQGGFVGEQCSFILFHDAREVGRHPFFPSNSNARQCFIVSYDTLPIPAVTRLKLHFGTSTDFYGRLVVYDLQVVGMDGMSNAVAAPDAL